MTDDCTVYVGCLESIRAPCNFKKARDSELFGRMVKATSLGELGYLKASIAKQSHTVDIVYNAIENRLQIEKQWEYYVDALEYFYAQSIGEKHIDRCKVMREYRKEKANDVRSE